MRVVFFLTVLINSLYFQHVYAIESYVIVKINNKIITNVDVNNEYRYLIALSPDLQDVDKKKVMALAKDSIIREKIKEDELSKFIDINVRNKFIGKIITNFYKKMGMVNKNEFENYLKEYKLSFSEVEKKIAIEAAWNDLIYKKFANQIEINEIKIKNELKKLLLNNKEQNVYFMSEILFTSENYENVNKKYETINKSILEIGFRNTATLHSISNSAKLGGEIGWIKESQLNPIIKKEIINLKIGEHTKPITIPGGFLVIKLDDQKKEEINVNFDEELNKQISREKNSQLQQFSEIYYKKIKKNSTISEK